MSDLFEVEFMDIMLEENPDEPLERTILRILLHNIGVFASVMLWMQKTQKIEEGILLSHSAPAALAELCEWALDKAGFPK